MAHTSKPLNAFFLHLKGALAFLIIALSIVGCSSALDSPETPSDVAFTNNDTAPATNLDAASNSDPGTIADLVSSQDTAVAPADSTTTPDTTSTNLPVINEGWIGGECADDNDCIFEGGYCLTDIEGFPNGMCSQNCDLYCPDQDDMVMTFCIDPDEVELFGETGLCTTRCDFGASSTGCREGYKCVPIPRFNDPGTIINSCVPGEETPAPNSPCYQQLIDRGISFTPGISPDASPDGFPELICHIEDPVWVDPVLHGVSFRYDSMEEDAKPIFASCAIALAMEETAAVLAEQGVTDVLHLGVYNCRVIGNTSDLSEHARANAIDIKGVKQANGEVITLQDHWEINTPSPVTDAGTFLKWFSDTMFDNYIYNIILTPDYNAAHWNHFHCDLTPGASFYQ